MLFRSKKKEFLNQLAYNERISDMVLVSRDGEWFISLGQRIDELIDEGVARVDMHHRRHSGWIVRMEIVYHRRKREMFLGDIVSKIENQGHGSRMLEFLISLSKELGCHVIRGNLSSNDADHFDKLRYWYEKYGFEVNIKDGQGTIRKYL